MATVLYNIIQVRSTEISFNISRCDPHKNITLCSKHKHFKWCDWWISNHTYSE